MSSMTETDKEELHKAVQAAVHESLGAYIIPKEQHFKDHLWLNEWREWQSNLTSTFWRSIVGIVITTVAMLLLFGFILFGKVNFK